MNLYPVCEAIAQAVVLEADRKRFEASAALAGMHLPRKRDPDEPPEIVWVGRMYVSNADIGAILALEGI